MCGASSKATKRIGLIDQYGNQYHSPEELGHVLGESGDPADPLSLDLANVQLVLEHFDNIADGEVPDDVSRLLYRQLDDGTTQWQQECRGSERQCGQAYSGEHGVRVDKSTASRSARKKSTAESQRKIAGSTVVTKSPDQLPDKASKESYASVDSPRVEIKRVRITPSTPWDFSALASRLERIAAAWVASVSLAYDSGKYNLHFLKSFFFGLMPWNWHTHGDRRAT